MLIVMGLDCNGGWSIRNGTVSQFLLHIDICNMDKWNKCPHCDEPWCTGERWHKVDKAAITSDAERLMHPSMVIRGFAWWEYGYIV